MIEHLPEGWREEHVSVWTDSELDDSTDLIPHILHSNLEAASGRGWRPPCDSC